MRIIAGIRRGQKLLEFDGQDVRPTTDRVRESMFNLIQGYCLDSVILDLFGGTGALSLEALSRGAIKGVVTDKDSRSIDLIRKNAERTGFLDKLEILKEDAMSYLERTTSQFHIVFLDPPYNKGFVQPILEKISEKGILTEDGIVVLEHDTPDAPEAVSGLQVLKQKKYGRCCITIYQRGDTH